MALADGVSISRPAQFHATTIVAVRKNGKEVRYIVYTDEGHGFARPETRLHFFAVTEEFLAKHMGGRAEPMGEIKGHSGQVR